MIQVQRHLFRHVEASYHLFTRCSISNTSIIEDQKIAKEDCKSSAKVAEKILETDGVKTRSIKDTSHRTPAGRDDIKVCIIGGSLASIYAAIILKQFPMIKRIHLIDPTDTLAAAVLDASHIDTSTRLKYFKKKNAKQGLKDMNIIALMDESDRVILDSLPVEQFKATSGYICEMAEETVRCAPDALIAVFARPVTTTLAAVSEIYKCAGWWDPDRLIGSIALESMRIEAMTANLLDLNPAFLSVPIVGGADPYTIVPLLSRARPINRFTNAQENMLLQSLRAADKQLTSIESRGPTLSFGMAAAKLILTLAKGLGGLDDVVSCAFVRSNVLPFCQYFATELQFGPGGVRKNLGLPKISPSEILLLERTIPIINEHVEIAIKQKKKTTIEILEDLDSKIKEIEQYGQDTEHKHKKIVGRLVIYSVVLYIMTAFIFYFYFFPASLFDQIFYITPLLLFPILILLTKKMVSWYYKRKISHNQEKLTTMEQEKKKILEEVTETETYKKAKEILLKFAPDQLRMTPLSPQPTFKVSPSIGTPLPPTAPQPTTPAAGELRRRVLSTQKQSVNAQPGIPTTTGVIPIGVAPPTPQQGTPFPQGARIVNPTAMGYRTPLPRPVLPRERTYLDRLVDYLVGDGPANRYALICRQCESHNGMALKEEFEYFGFRCCYCNYWNPARKQKPPAPKLEQESVINSSLLSNISKDSLPTNLEPLKLGEIETSTSDTDSDIEVVERPVEMTDAAEHTVEECPNQIETAAIETDTLKSEVLEKEESEHVEKMEVDESYS
ncbi:hypothetical protein KM043_004342 [Ampulex compressa]|nr:hypothetical protein KM043_004342 [Ampulex compressa]